MIPNLKALAFVVGGIAVATGLFVRKIDKNIKKSDENFEKALEELRKNRRDLDIDIQKVKDRLNEEIVDEDGNPSEDQNGFTGDSYDDPPGDDPDFGTRR
jgi:hypothetical protein